MNGSNGNVVALLERLLEEQVKTREEQVRTREELRGELMYLRADTNRGFAQVNARIEQTNTRIDNVLVIAGRHSDDHEQRIQVLEARVLGKSG